MVNIQVFTDWAKELGFAKVGFCSTEAFLREKEIVETQEPLAERKQLRFSPQADLPQAKSIAVLLWPYAPASMEGEGTVFVDSYYAASNAAYHAAKALEDRMQEAGCFAKANVSYPAKEAAVRAGMGRTGLNSLLITPEYGSRVVIILMATDIEYANFDANSEMHSCLNCGKCVAACPAGAIDGQGMSHPERCLRNFMMEGVVVPIALRQKIGMRMIGCDICQRVCPLQPVAPQKQKAIYRLEEFVTKDAAAFSSAVTRLADEIGRNAARPQRVRAQAALLAGNAKDPSYLPALRLWAQMPFEAVREHARWAIEQIESQRDNA